MTQFDKSKLIGTEYVMYDGRFVARFKRGGRADFLKFLVKNYTVEEYFSQLEEHKTPLGVLKLKGYVTPMTKKVLAIAGYSQDAAGEAQYLVDQVKKYSTKVV